MNVKVNTKKSKKSKKSILTFQKVLKVMMKSGFFFADNKISNLQEFNLFNISYTFLGIKEFISNVEFIRNSKRGKIFLYIEHSYTRYLVTLLLKEFKSINKFVEIIQSSRNLNIKKKSSAHLLIVIGSHVNSFFLEALRKNIRFIHVINNKQNLPISGVYHMYTNIPNMMKTVFIFALMDKIFRKKKVRPIEQEILVKKDTTVVSSNNKYKKNITNFNKQDKNSNKYLNKFNQYKKFNDKFTKNIDNRKNGASSTLNLNNQNKKNSFSKNYYKYNKNQTQNKSQINADFVKQPQTGNKYYNKNNKWHNNKVISNNPPKQSSSENFIPKKYYYDKNKKNRNNLNTPSNNSNFNTNQNSTNNFYSKKKSGENLHANLTNVNKVNSKNFKNSSQTYSKKVKSDVNNIKASKNTNNTHRPISK